MVKYLLGLKRNQNKISKYLEIIQVPDDREADKNFVVCVHNGILFVYEKIYSHAICFNLNVTWRVSC